MNRAILIIIVALFISNLAWCQQDMEHLFISDTLNLKKNVQVLGLPVVFYTPETSFGFGGGLQLFFHHRRNIFNARVSNIFASAIYTTKNQLLLNVIPQLYLYNGKMYLEGDVLYKIFPNSFWGVGPNTVEDALEKYNMETITVRVALLNRIPPNVNFGFEFNFENHKMLEVQEGGLLDTNQVVGWNGARISGLSFVFNFDDRDNVYSPQEGNYLIFKGGFSSKSFGASHSFNRYTIDMRKYFLFMGKHTFAAQLYLQSNFGDAPFQSIAWLGGPERNRGYFRGRYMDKHYLLLQTELRLRFFKRFQINAFFSYGEVTPVPSELFTYPKFSYGGGVRFQLIKTNPTLIRMDIGANQYGGTGLYFGVNEAF